MPRGNGGGLPVGRRRRPGRPTSGAPGTAGPALPAGTRRGIAPMQSSCDQTARQSTPRPPANPGHPTRPLAGNRMGLTVIPGQCPPRRHGDVHRDSSGQPGLTRRTPDLPAPGTGVSQQRSQLNGHTTRDIRLRYDFSTLGLPRPTRAERNARRAVGDIPGRAAGSWHGSYPLISQPGIRRRRICGVARSVITAGVMSQAGGGSSPSGRGGARARPASSRAGRRRGARLPPHRHPAPARRRRRNLEPVRDPR